ncbi:MAG: thiosulfohydrolase SoxB, partial [Rhodospirillaceae bacterium]|nr:thiosulfohydrolase SoxB [Rhodospirillaceae bacterium]
MKPLWYREPAINLGAGADRGLPPHLSAKAMMKAFGLQPGSLEAYAFTADDFTHLAHNYGKV